MKKTINEMALYWTICVIVVAVLFALRLWVVPFPQNMPYLMTAILVISVLFGSMAFLLMLVTAVVNLFKKDRAEYKPAHGLKTGELVETGFLVLFVIFLEVQGMLSQQKSLAAASKSSPTPSVETSSFMGSTPVPTTAPVVAPARPTAKQIDCVGPDKVVFEATEAECSKLNAAWGVTIPTYSPPPTVKVATPTSPCVLSFGTYNLTATDCAKFKQQDQSLQDWNNSLQILKDYQGSTYDTGQSYDSGDTSDYVYIDYSQQNTVCKDDVQEWLNDEIRSIEAVGRANGSGSSSEVEYKISQAQSQANAAVVECDRLYPVQ